MADREYASEMDIARLRTGLMGEGAGGAGSLLRAHVRDIGAPDLGPDVCGIDVLSFRGLVTTAGVITQPAKLTLPGGMWADLFEVNAWMEAPGTDPELAACITFTVKDAERSGANLFSSDWYFADFFNPAGGFRPAYFPRGMYRFDPGSDVQVKLAIDTDGTNGYAAKASANKYWGVTLRFALYAVAVE